MCALGRRIRGTRFNYGYRFKASVADSCIGGLEIVNQLATDICQTGLTDGYFDGT